MKKINLFLCLLLALLSVESYGQCLNLTVNSFDVDCQGNSTGFVDITPNNGQAPYTYNWLFGSNTNSATSYIVDNLPAGTYGITVTDNVGCATVTSVTINEPISAISVSAVVSSSYNGMNISCNGGSDGEATATASGGTVGINPYTYLWGGAAGAQISNIATGLAAGSYSVTATDANGCSDVASVTLTEPTAISATISSATDPSAGNCDGTITAIGSGGTGFMYTYLWMPAMQTTATALNLCGGNHTVTVGDANGCVGSIQHTLTATSCQLNISATTYNNSCHNSTDGVLNIVINSGQAPYTYHWNGGSSSNSNTSHSIAGLGAGGYTITVSDALGCDTVVAFVINAPSPVTASISNIIHPTVGNCNGSLTTTATGGTPSYTYLWVSGMSAQTTSTINNLCTGSHTITVTDANGCTASTTHTLNTCQLNVTAIPMDVLCRGAADGFLDITINNGQPPYTYHWNGLNNTNANSNHIIGNLAAGVYQVTISDALGCDTLISFIINEPATPVSVVATVSSNYNGTDISCNGNSDGSATATAAGGTVGINPYTYLWGPATGNQVGSTVTGLPAGAYNVTATDANGCSDIATVFLTEPSAVSTTVASTIAPTAGNCNGTITFSATGGNAPYAWNGGSGPQASSTVTNLCAGNHTVTATDINGCATTITHTLNNCNLNIFAINNNVLCFGGTSGSIDITVNSGQAPYTYSWIGGSNNTSSPTFSINNLSADSYAITVNDANGCDTVFNIIINEPLPLTLTPQILSNFNGSAISCPSESDGGVGVVATGGSGGITYLWSPGNLTTADITNIPAGTYCVTVTDGQGCSDDTCITITDPVPLAATHTQTDISCHGLTDGEITVSAVAGTGTLGASGYEYNITGPGQTGNVFTALSAWNNLTAGIYTVDIRDGNNCEEQLSISIAEPSPLAVTISHNDASAIGVCDGDLTINVTGGTAPYSYNINNGAPTVLNTLTNLCAGQYDVIVIDANGCTGADTIILQVNGASCVWPGDANSDNITNNFDILPIGLHHGDVGNIRPNANLNYNCQPSPDWGTGISGNVAIDIKHVDTDGNAVINDADTNAIILNWSQTHLKSNTWTSHTGVEIYIDTAVVNPGDTISLPVILTSSTPTNGYGVAFTINYDPVGIDSSSARFDFGTSWLGTIGNDMIGIQKDFYNTGEIEVGMTRIDHNSIGGNGGIIGHVHFTIKDDVLPKSNNIRLDFNISDVRFIDQNGVEIPVTPLPSQILVTDINLNVEAINNPTNTIKVFPNPTRDWLHIRSNQGILDYIQVCDLTGKVVLQQDNLSSNHTDLDLSKLENGLYIITIQSGNQRKNIRVIKQ